MLQKGISSRRGSHDTTDDGPELVSTSSLASPRPMGSVMAEQVLDFELSVVRRYQETKTDSHHDRQ